MPNQKQCDKCKVRKQCPLNEPIDNSIMCMRVANFAYAAGHFDGVLAGSKIGQVDGVAVEHYKQIPLEAGNGN